MRNNNNQVDGVAEDSQSNNKTFDDRLDKFVQTMKELTQVEEINLFSPELYQIYTDVESKRFLNYNKE